MSAQFLKFDVSKFVVISDEVQKAQWFGRNQQIENGQRPTIFVKQNHFEKIGSVEALSGTHALALAKKRYPEIPSALLAVEDPTETWEPFEFPESAVETLH